MSSGAGGAARKAEQWESISADLGRSRPISASLRFSWRLDVGNEVGDMGRYGEMWGDMGRYGEMWRLDVGNEVEIEVCRRGGCIRLPRGGV